MKKFLLFFTIVAMSFGAEAQLVPLKVYNGMLFPIVVQSVVVHNTATCTFGSISFPNQVVMPGAFATILPLFPGDPTKEWSGSKIRNISNTSFMRTIHPYFEACWLPSVSFGAPAMTGYWYPLGSSPFQLIKVYP